MPELNITKFPLQKKYRSQLTGQSRPSEHWHTHSLGYMFIDKGMYFSTSLPAPPISVFLPGEIPFLNDNSGHKTSYNVLVNYRGSE